MNKGRIHLPKSGRQSGKDERTTAHINEMSLFFGQKRGFKKSGFFLVAR